MMNFEDSDEEYDESQAKLYYWNNWIPNSDSHDTDVISKYPSKRSKQNLIPQGEVNKSQGMMPMQVGNKVMPSSLLKTDVRNEIKLLKNAESNSKRQENLGKREFDYSHGESSRKISEFPLQGDNNVNYADSKGGFDINKDWGKRTELHNILHINDGDKVWNVISRSIFAEIKLWKNEYGNICCKATGKISVKGESEKSFIEINTEENLRKMLHLSNMQWSALCETVKERNCSLKFNALNDADLTKSSSLEKLWFFICKRRHFLPNICVLGKLSGAVKLLKEFEIIPKLVVIETRDFKGEEIS